MLGPGSPTAHDDHPLPGELGGPRVVRRVQLPPAEGLLARVARPERPVPGPRGVDQGTRRVRPLGRLDEQPPALALTHRAHLDGPVHPQAEGALVRVEVRPDHLGRWPAVVGAGQLQAGQGVHAVHLAVRQRGPAELPGTAGARGVVEDHEVAVRFQAAAPQMVGGGQACLPGTDHHDIH